MGGSIVVQSAYRLRRGAVVMSGASPSFNRYILRLWMSVDLSAQSGDDQLGPRFFEIQYMTATEAQRIAQDFLDRQGEATLAGDIEATLAWCDLPCTLESMEGQVVANSEDEMRAICVAFIDGLRQRQLTHMARRCLEALFKSENTIWATYETRYIQSGNLVAQEPYVGFVILKHRGDRWKINTMRFAVQKDSPANVTLRDWEQKGLAE